jgi:hypothetical protein
VEDLIDLEVDEKFLKEIGFTAVEARKLVVALKKRENGNKEKGKEEINKIANTSQGTEGCGNLLKYVINTNFDLNRSKKMVIA